MVFGLFELSKLVLESLVDFKACIFSSFFNLSHHLGCGGPFGCQSDVRLDDGEHTPHAIRELNFVVVDGFSPASPETNTLPPLMWTMFVDLIHQNVKLEWSLSGNEIQKFLKQSPQ